MGGEGVVRMMEAPGLQLKYPARGLSHTASSSCIFCSRKID